MQRTVLLTLMFSLSTLCGLMGQGPGQIIADSVVKKMKIRQVTENWFTNLNETKPANTTYEIFDSAGNRLQRVHINYFYHKFVNNYSYNYKKGIIIEQQEYFDWNPYREKNKGDTILKRSTHKYAITAKNKKNSRGGIDRFTPRLLYDTAGKLVQRTDSIKFGYQTTHFSYNDNGQLIERKISVSRFSATPRLESIDSLFYVGNTHLVNKEISYYNIKENGGQLIYDRMVETRYSYNEYGLPDSKEVFDRYLTIDNKTGPSKFKYHYSFF